MLVHSGFYLPKLKVCMILFLLVKRTSRPRFIWKGRAWRYGDNVHVNEKKRLCMIKSYNKRNATYQEIGQPNIYFYPAVPALSIEIILIRTSWTTWWLRRCDSMKLEEKNSIWSVIDKTSGTLVKRIEDNTYQQMLKRRTETIYSNTKAKGIWERMSRLRVLSNQKFKVTAVVLPPPKIRIPPTETEIYPYTTHFNEILNVQRLAKWNSFNKLTNKNSIFINLYYSYF